LLTRLVTKIEAHSVPLGGAVTPLRISQWSVVACPTLAQGQRNGTDLNGKLKVDKKGETSKRMFMTSSSNQSGETTRIFDNVARRFFSKVAFAVPKKAKAPAA
jgi:hypothetical protein